MLTFVHRNAIGASEAPAIEQAFGLAVRISNFPHGRDGTKGQALGTPRRGGALWVLQTEERLAMVLCQGLACCIRDIFRVASDSISPHVIRVATSVASVADKRAGYRTVFTYEVSHRGGIPL